MLKSYIIKNRKMLFILQTVIFMVFIFFTTIYCWDRSAHIHFNRPIEILNFQSIFSMIMTYLFIAFLIITLIYPILLMIQIYYMRKIKGSGKKLVLLSILYLLSVIAVFTLWTINGSHSIKIANPTSFVN
ncbi:MAG TPA: hypothetical protein DIT10_23215 [Chryseobacterium sp.]|nr:hypothetical protein [Chryseobacterium sp.]